MGKSITDFRDTYNEPLFTIEEVSGAIGMWPSATRQWISRAKIASLDAELGVRGRRVLFSPCDLLQLLIASRFSHAQITFKGDSPVERREYPTRTLDEEIRGQVHTNLYGIIYDMGELELGKPTVFSNGNIEDSRYFVIFFDSECFQTVNGKKINFGGINFRATSNPLELGKGEGLIIIIDCFELANIALSLFRNT